MVYVENELIGKRLKQIRRQAELDYTDMADILEISEGHYRKLERGVYGLDVRKILMLYSKLDVDPLYLLTGKRGIEFQYNLEEGKTDRNALVCELLDYCKQQLADKAED